ncbi:hypothetical protein ADUPG1_013370 [Aduncisulcus paluster]|uniref:Uncharacterized protein n=1 Tax=Aduncisulcus paluster TaxID=2918883 RepID=A0ABQ5K2N2_9EUKA|nr:hypothetical protein ADUPG1_013370 [Aduncisulcus paluster]
MESNIILKREVLFEEYAHIWNDILKAKDIIEELNVIEQIFPYPSKMTPIERKSHDMILLLVRDVFQYAKENGFTLYGSFSIFSAWITILRTLYVAYQRSPDPECVSLEHALSILSSTIPDKNVTVREARLCSLFIGKRMSLHKQLIRSVLCRGKPLRHSQRTLTIIHPIVSSILPLDDGLCQIEIDNKKRVEAFQKKMEQEEEEQREQERLAQEKIEREEEEKQQKIIQDEQIEKKRLEEEKLAILKEEERKKAVEEDRKKEEELLSTLSDSGRRAVKRAIHEQIEKKRLEEEKLAILKEEERKKAVEEDRKKEEELLSTLSDSGRRAVKRAIRGVMATYLDKSKK